MAFAYSPQRWELHCDSAEHLAASSGGSYSRHFVETVLFSFQLVIAGIAGFTHAFVACLVPFVAEEVGSEVCLIGQHLQAVRRAYDNDKVDDAQEKKVLDETTDSAQRLGIPYAFSPQRWIWVVDGQAHVKFSGGSYTNHCRFACWASAQWFVGAAAGLIHAVFPSLLPTVHEGVALELGGLIINRRKLRNLLAQEKKQARAAAAAANGEALREEEEEGDNPADQVAVSSSGKNVQFLYHMVISASSIALLFGQCD